MSDFDLTCFLRPRSVMVVGGVELIASVRRDQVFGTMLMVGIGGYFTETLKDVQFGHLPAGTEKVPDRGYRNADRLST